MPVPAPVAVWLPATLLVAACSGSSGGGGSDLPASYGYGSVDGGGGQSTVTVTGTVVGLGSTPTAPIVQLAGVSVCVLGHAEIPCAMTDLAGSFSLAKMAPGTDTGFTFTKTGYYGLVLLANTGTSDLKLPTANLSTDAAEQAFFQAAGWTYPSSDQGVLHVHVQGSGQTSCDGLGQIALTSSAGATPVYEKTCADANTPGGPDPTLTATTSSGNGDFLVAAGPVDATATSSTLLCGVSPFPGWGLPSSSANSVHGIVVGGHETIVALQCK